MAEAKRTGFVVYGIYSNFVEYEYKGKKYEVEYSNCNTYLCTSPMVQHRDKQAEIDELIRKETEVKKEYKYEDTAEYGFNLFWEYVNK